MPGIPQDGRFREPAKQNKTKQNTADSVVWTGNDSVSIRAVFCFVLFCFVLGNQGRWTVPKKEGGKASGWAPEIKPKHRKSLFYQMEDNKAGPSAPPQWGGASRRPLGVSCCLQFGKDFRCFWHISGPLLDLHGPSRDFILDFRFF